MPRIQFSRNLFNAHIRMALTPHRTPFLLNSLVASNHKMVKLMTMNVFEMYQLKLHFYLAPRDSPPASLYQTAVFPLKKVRASCEITALGVILRLWSRLLCLMNQAEYMKCGFMYIYGEFVSSPWYTVPRPRTWILTSNDESFERLTDFYVYFWMELSKKWSMSPYLFLESPLISLNDDWHIVYSGNVPNWEHMSVR